jgi:hypothetical protein
MMIRFATTVLLVTFLYQPSGVGALSTKNGSISRRQAIGSAFGLSTFALNIPAFAAAEPPTQAELDRMREGYKGIVYLLNNFESETTTCKDNGGGKDSFWSEIVSVSLRLV